MKQYKFSVEEIKKLTKSMVILVDSREKKNWILGIILFCCHLPQQGKAIYISMIRL